MGACVRLGVNVRARSRGVCSLDGEWGGASAPNTPLTPTTRAPTGSKIPVTTRRVIYHLIDDVRAMMQKRAPYDEKATVVGRAEVQEVRREARQRAPCALLTLPLTARQVFTINAKTRRAHNIAGCLVRDGKLQRHLSFRLLRGDKVVKRSLRADSLRHFKDTVKEVTRGNECGLSLEGEEDVRAGDVIECYEAEREQVKIKWPDMRER